MSRESAFIDHLKAIARHPAARGLADDCAVLPMGTCDLVLTHDMLVEGVHYLPDDPPADVAWKLVAVNLSDLAAKGARPTGVLMGYMLGGDAGWDAAFAEGLGVVLDYFDVPLLGGDTVSAGEGRRALGLAAIGEVAPGGAPSRGGARDGDALWTTGVIGAAGLGLEEARGQAAHDPAALAAYRRPMPLLAEGQALAPLVHAMADISDGLLIDARRMAAVSGLAVEVDVDAAPIAPGYGDGIEARLRAVTAGDDYQLLFAAPPALTIPSGLSAIVTRIGRFHSGDGLKLVASGRQIPLPPALGYEHG